MSGCEYYQELISRMLDDDLSCEESAVLVEHLESCEDCSAMRDAFAAISGFIEDDLIEAPEVIRTNVMAEICRADIMSKHKPLISKRAKALLATAACFVLVVSVTAFARPRLKSDSAMVIDTSVSEAAPAEAPAAAADAYEADTGSTEEAPAEEAAAAFSEEDLEEETAAYGIFSLQTADDSEGGLSSFSILISWDELSELLAGFAAEITEEELVIEESFSISYILNNEEMSLSIFSSGGILYYTDPADGTFKQASCTLDSIAFFLT